MSQQALLRRVATALDDAGIPYMVTGSLASSLQGEPRATHDIDLVVAVSASDVPRLVASLAGPDLYLDAVAVAEAVRQRAMFNLIQPASGDKVDFWLLKDEPYDGARFGRRITVDALGMRFAVSAPEDTILMKLRWARRSGGSEKQVADALGVYEVQARVLDRTYLKAWAGRLGVSDLLAELEDRAEPLEG